MITDVYCRLSKCCLISWTKSHSKRFASEVKAWPGIFSEIYSPIYCAETGERICIGRFDSARFQCLQRKSVWIYMNMLFIEYGTILDILEPYSSSFCISFGSFRSKRKKVSLPASALAERAQLRGKQATMSPKEAMEAVNAASKVSLYRLVEL